MATLTAWGWSRFPQLRFHSRAPPACPKNPRSVNITIIMIIGHWSLIIDYLSLIMIILWWWWYVYNGEVLVWHKKTDSPYFFGHILLEFFVQIFSFRNLVFRINFENKFWFFFFLNFVCFMRTKEGNFSDLFQNLFLEIFVSDDTFFRHFWKRLEAWKVGKFPSELSTAGAKWGVRSLPVRSVSSRLYI